MHTRGLKLLIALFAAVIGGLTIVAPASADEGDTPVIEDDGSDLAGRIRNQMSDLNEGRPAGGGSKPPTCTWTDDDGNEHDDGELRWRLSRAGQDGWDDIYDGDPEGGTWYRYECWHPDMACDAPEWPGDDGCYGELLYDGCGDVVCEFDAINPSTLAWLAVDDFIQTLPPPKPQFNPPVRTYVNFPTWLWVENIPEGQRSAPTMRVPGITVHTTAEVNSIGWKMGDGKEFTCALTTTEASASTECTHEYIRSSANQPGNVYTGEASVVWRATWTVPEFGMTGQVDAPRSTEFQIGVAEVQAIVR